MRLFFLYLVSNYQLLIYIRSSLIIIIHLGGTSITYNSYSYLHYLVIASSGRYNIKGTRLADLSTPLHDAVVAVQDEKKYVTIGDSPIEDTIHQVYVYNINTDQWGQLPLSSRYYSILHIIDGKLADT